MTVVDGLTKEGLFIVVAGSIRSQQLIQVLEKLINKRGCPLILRSDNGPEFVSLALLQWATNKGLRNLVIEPSSHGSTTKASMAIKGRIFRNGLVLESRTCEGD